MSSGISAQRELIGDDQLLDRLTSAGFEFRGSDCLLGENVAQWDLSPPDTRRHVYLRVHQGARRVYSIYVEEWRGGEGYEDEEFRSERSSEALEAIGAWVEWANEPFVQTRRGWFREFLGMP